MPLSTQPRAQTTAHCIHIQRQRSIMASTQKEVALIVGASRGIGRQIAIDLAREGYAGIYSTQT
jgi:hypothetical protein